MLRAPGYENSIFLPHWRQAGAASSNAVKRRGTARQTLRQRRADHRWQFHGYAFDEACERHGGRTERQSADQEYAPGGEAGSKPKPYGSYSGKMADPR
jgi:hypothetical protein